MTIYQLYKLADFILGVHRNGKGITVPNFEDLWNRRQVDYFQEVYKLYEIDTDNSDSLRLFKNILEQTDITVVSNSYFELPTNYFHYSAMTYIDDDSNCYAFDMVTKSQYVMRKASTLTAPSLTHPICYEFDNKLYIYPHSSVLDLEFQYLRYPNDIVLDFYIDSDGEQQFLDSGDEHVWGDDEYDADGTAKSSADGTHTSLTTESEWGGDDNLKILTYILRDMGVSMIKLDVYKQAEIQRNED